MRRFSFVLGAVTLVTLAPIWGTAADTEKITVFAAASLREAFEAAAPAFTKKTGIDVAFNFGGSDTLAAQITQGAPADAFASANVTQMKKVVDASLAASVPTTFARNSLVVIVPKTNPANVKEVMDLSRFGVKVVLAAATVPVGSYARAAFGKMSGQNGTAVDFPSAVEKNVVSNELDVKAVATKIALGEGDAGVVYQTDVAPGIASKVKIIAFPSGVAPEAMYPIAVLKAAANPNGAQAFVMFILGDGQAYLKARGFLSP